MHLVPIFIRCERSFIFSRKIESFHSHRWILQKCKYNETFENIFNKLENVDWYMSRKRQGFWIPKRTHSSNITFITYYLFAKIMPQPAQATFEKYVEREDSDRICLYVINNILVHIFHSFCFIMILVNYYWPGVMPSPVVIK